MGDQSVGEDRWEKTHPKEKDMQNLNRKMGKRGQGLVEYILVVVLMAIVAISVVQQLSTSTQKGFTKASDNLDQVFGG
jgi:Flp pilus assembly pilin Flp